MTFLHELCRGKNNSTKSSDRSIVPDCELDGLFHIIVTGFANLKRFHKNNADATAVIRETELDLFQKISQEMNDALISLKYNKHLKQTDANYAPEVVYVQDCVTKWYDAYKK